MVCVFGIGALDRVYLDYIGYTWSNFDVHFIFVIFYLGMHVHQVYGIHFVYMSALGICELGGLY